MIRSLKTILEALPANSTLDLGDEVVQGSTDIRLRNDGIHIKNGRPIGPIGIHLTSWTTAWWGKKTYRPTRDFIWEKADGCGGEADQHYGISLLGGINAQLIGWKFVNGAAYGQLGIGLDSMGGVEGTPRDWDIVDCSFLDNSMVPRTDKRAVQDHNAYLFTGIAASTNGRLLRCKFGPGRNGAIVKVGGTGNDPRFEGSIGIDFVDTEIIVDKEGDTSIVVEGAHSRAIRFFNTKVNLPSQIRVTDGASVDFYGTFPEGTTYVTYYDRPKDLRLNRRDLVGPSGKMSFPGVRFLPAPTTVN